VSRKPLLVVLVMVALVALGVAAWYEFSSPSSSTADAVPGAGAQGVTVTAWDKTMGNPKAPVLMVEYAAPSCPHCAHFDKEYFQLLKKKYIDTGKVYYVLRVFPLSPADVAAEAIARCLPADNYFQFLDLLWRNQMKWDPEFQVPDVHAGLVEMGRIAGMSAAKVDSCIADQKTAAKITEVGSEGTSKYGINSVPSFVINGQTQVFGGDWVTFSQGVDDTLKKKK
jgi:protein-disulfide isomerase